MAFLKVHNDFHRDHVEDFKGDIISIAANSFVWMTRSDAIKFKAQYMHPESNNANDPKFRPKMIRVDRSELRESIPSNEEVKNYVCQVDGVAFKTKQELDNHIKTTYLKDIPNEQPKEEKPKRRR